MLLTPYLRCRYWGNLVRSCSVSSIDTWTHLGCPMRDWLHYWSPRAHCPFAQLLHYVPRDRTVHGLITPLVANTPRIAFLAHPLSQPIAEENKRRMFSLDCQVLRAEGLRFYARLCDTSSALRHSSATISAIWIEVSHPFSHCQRSAGSDPHDFVLSLEDATQHGPPDLEPTRG